MEHDPRSGADPCLLEPRAVESFPEGGGIDDGLVVADVDEAKLQAPTWVVGAAEHAARNQHPDDYLQAYADGTFTRVDAGAPVRTGHQRRRPRSCAR